MALLQGILQDALERKEYWRLKDAAGKPPGVVGWWPSRAITFLDNHDTGLAQTAGLLLLLLLLELGSPIFPLLRVSAAAMQCALTLPCSTCCGHMGTTSHVPVYTRYLLRSVHSQL